jgi:hypothetical protein
MVGNSSPTPILGYFRFAGDSPATLESSFRWGWGCDRLPTNQQIIVQNDNVACAKMRRAAEPVLNAPPARDVERLKYEVPSTPTGVP